MAEKEKFPTYKGKPLVRCGDVLYYGNMDERYVIRLQIKSKKTVNDLEVADKVTVQLMCTDPDISPRKQVVKASEKNRPLSGNGHWRDLAQPGACLKRIRITGALSPAWFHAGDSLC